MKKLSNGFTLIELLIVIALLGALAVGLLAAMDPFEQLKKGTDTGIRNTVSEIHGAFIRYFAIKNEMPYGTSAPSETPVNVAAKYSDLGFPAVIESGELKSDFPNLAGKQLSQISLMGTTESLTVCFKPLSKSMRNDPNTIFKESDFTRVTNPSDCGSGTSFTCLWCVL